jgi:hypothetical protein
MPRRGVGVLARHTRIEVGHAASTRAIATFPQTTECERLIIPTQVLRRKLHNAFLSIAQRGLPWMSCLLVPGGHYPAFGLTAGAVRLIGLVSQSSSAMF